MMFPKNRALGPGHLYGLLIAAVILSLTCSLATRFSVQADSHVHSIKASDNRSAECKQHLDQDHARVAGPVPTIVSFKPSGFFAYALPDESSRLHDGLPQSLYTRPPPFSKFSL